LAGPGDEGDDIDMSDPRLLALPERPRDFMSIADLYRARLRETRPRRVTATQLNRLLGRAQRSPGVNCLLRLEDKRWLRVLLQTADGAALPLVVRKGKGKVTLAIADGGKAEALKRMQVGGSLAAFDWRGQGESAPPENSWWSQRAAHYTAFAGEPLPGGRVTDLLAAAQWLEQEGIAAAGIVSFGGEASLIACLAATIVARLPRLELHGMPRTFADAPGLAGQVSFTAWVPGLALVTDIPQLLAGLGKRARVRSWLKPGKEPVREGSD
jgi:hypothetical protein